VNKQTFIFIVVLILIRYSISAQKKYNFVFKISSQILTPKSNVFSIKGADINYHGYMYDLKISPYRSYGLDIMLGNEFLIKKYRKFVIFFPLNFQYKFFEIQQKQTGEYSGGYSFLYFNGLRDLKTKYHLIAFSSGLNFNYIDSTSGKEWELVTLIAANLSTRNVVNIKETPVNCATCKAENFKYTNKDFTLFPSFEVSVSRLYKIKKIKLGYSVGYIYNIPPKLSYLNISLNNLNDYNLFEVGLKLKL
jgi:hypothetical protein